MNDPLRDTSVAAEDSSTRHRILVATAEVLARSGQTKLSLSEVALQAGVSRPTLYRWFASKQELLDAFGIHEREMFDNGISKATAGLRGTEKLDAALRFIVEYQHSYSGVRLVDIEPEVVIGQLGRILPMMRARLEKLLSGPNGAVKAATAIRVAISHYIVRSDDDDQFWHSCGTRLGSSSPADSSASIRGDTSAEVCNAERMTSVQDETGVLAGDERMLIDGELQHTSSGATFDVIHPASEEVAGQATDGTDADMERAVGAARRAFDQTDWSRDLDFRYHCLTQLHAAFERNKEHLRRVLITEVGCPVKVTGSQIESPIEEVKHWAEHGKNFEYLADNGVHETPMGPARRKIHYEPVGVVGAITRGTFRSTSTSPKRSPH